MRLLVLLIVLAGCTQAPVAAVPEETVAPGTLRGVVVDEAIMPVADATVALVGTELLVLTDTDGAFSFDGLEPGTYFVTASKIGHEQVQASAVVGAGTLTLQLPRIPGIQPSFNTLQFDGFYECAFAGWFITDSCDFVVRTVHDETGVGPRGIQNNVNTEFYDLEPAVQTLIQEGFFDTQDVPNFRFSIADTPIDNACDCSPVFLESISDTGYAYGRLDAGGGFPSTERPFAVRGFIPFQEEVQDVAYALNVRFQVFTTKFHHYEAPEGWNMLEQDQFPRP